MSIEKHLKIIPPSPGVYFFKNDKNTVLYVGKATNLKKRIKSYFGPHAKIIPKSAQLLSDTTDIEFIVTNSDIEAVILECELIKKYRPHYNVRLKDDKTYPYLKIDIDNDWPSVSITRNLEKDHARYFGPFASAYALRNTLRTIKKIFPLRSCTKVITGKGAKPCLNYHIHRCLGPCIGAISQEEYRKIVSQVIMFLEGKQDLVLQELSQAMEACSSNLEYEKAAIIRDQIKAIQHVKESQTLAISINGDLDVIAFTQAQNMAYVAIFFIRNNTLIGRDYRIIEGIYNDEPNHIITSFIKQYYNSASYIPAIIMIQYPVEDELNIMQWLSYLKGSKVKLVTPKKGGKKALLDLANENAKRCFDLYQIKKSTEFTATITLEELQNRLNLPKIPLRIEGYDISNIKGNLAVGSMVVFENGMSKRSLYRKFKVKTVPHINDYAMIQEILRRRFQNLMAKKDKWSLIPDLVIIDGGKGHLNAAMTVLREQGLHHISLVGLAKRNEDLFVFGKSQAIEMPPNSAAFHLLQMIRDEAHRFALQYHRRLRQKKGIASILNDVPGIGPKRSSALLAKFNSLQSIKNASYDELSTIKGMTRKTAYILKEYL